MSIRGKQHVLLLLVGVGFLCYLVSQYVSNRAFLQQQRDKRDQADDTDTASPIQYGKMVKNNRPKRVLVTGAAGFIGYSLAKTLATNENNVVVAVDNFNDYYDVRLKIDRAYELHQQGVKVYNEDLCNQALLEELFSKYTFTHVAHMAAQAGVRYSLKNPLAYVHSNVECQVALLEVMVKHPQTKLIYASTSSVYGKFSKVPFHLSANTDLPGNMYAATKKTDEMLGFHYCDAHSMQAVGVRFFTVYGPWGRPDMAVYKFSEAMLEGKEVPMFHVSDDNPLGRDFTYVDDIVDGLLALLDYRTHGCGEHFNLGYGHPVSVPGMIKILEKELGISAKVKKLPLPPTEILRTWADISASQKILNFYPKVDLKEGVRRFVAWFRGYRLQRQDEKMTKKPTPAERWFAKILEEKAERAKRYKEEAVFKHNSQLNKRLQRERDRYVDWAKSNNVEVRKMKKRVFIQFEGYNASGGDIIRSPALKGNIAALRKRCLEVEQCIAFHTDGALKGKLPLSHLWQKRSSSKPSEGLFVADVNMCEEDLHDCSQHAACQYKGPGQFLCECLQGYVGNGQVCLPVYGGTPTKEMERDNLVDYFSLYNITEMKHGRKLIFFPGLDSPGGDFMVASQYRLQLSKLEQACKAEKFCVGINSNGIMKKRIQPKNKWVKWTESGNEGILIFDIDYCLLDDDRCPDKSECKRLGAADYRCVCEEPYVMEAEACVRPPPIRVTPKELMKDGAENSHHSARGKVVKIKQTNTKQKSNKKENSAQHARKANMDNSKMEKKDKKAALLGTKPHQSVQDEQVNQRAHGIPRGVGQHGKIDHQDNLQEVPPAGSTLAPPGEKHSNQGKDGNQRALAHGNQDKARDGEILNHENVGNNKEKASVRSPDGQVASNSSLKQAEQNEHAKPSEGGRYRQKENTADAHQGGEDHARDVALDQGGEPAQDHVDIIMSVDEKSFPGVPAVIHSVKSHTKTTVRFHILVSGSKPEALKQYLSCFGTDILETVEIAEFNSSTLTPEFTEYMSSLRGSQHGYLAGQGNFARFFFHRIFTSLNRAIYLDADLVVLDDIYKLWNMVTGHTTVISAVKRTQPPYGFYFRKTVQEPFKVRYGKDLDPSAATFNAGVFAVSLRRWRHLDVQIEDDLVYWMTQNKGHKLWAFGTQPLMLLTFYKQWTPVDSHWNEFGLGYKAKSDVKLQGAGILHWSGKSKPWSEENPFHRDWLQQKPRECNTHGLCSKSEKSGWQCSCKAGFIGVHCDSDERDQHP